MSEVSLDALVEDGFDVGSKYDFRTRDNPVVDNDEDDVEELEQ